MEFLKKRNDYIVMYSKQQAVKLLRADKRVKKVEVTDKKMYIYTHPITPIVTREDYKGSFLCPIGIYKITISSCSKYIDCKIKRENWYRGMHHYHIKDGWSGDGICWGSADNEVDIIKDNKDWFWLVKRCLDLLEDGNPESGETEKWYDDMYDLMINYAKGKKNRKLADKLKKIQEIKLKNYR